MKKWKSIEKQPRHDIWVTEIHLKELNAQRKKKLDKVLALLKGGVYEIVP